MPVRPADSDLPPALFGLKGELISLRITAEPKLLEDLLETLSSVDFPVNPQLYHRHAEVAVEFPAYSDQVQEVREALRRDGFDTAALKVMPVLTFAGGA